MKNILALIADPIVLIGALAAAIVFAPDDDEAKPAVPTVDGTVDPTAESTVATVADTVEATVESKVADNVALPMRNADATTESDSIRRAMSILGKRSAEKRKMREQIK